MTITNFSALMAQIVDLLKENDREKPRCSKAILMNVDWKTGTATAFIADENVFVSGYHICSRPAHYDDTLLSDMYDGLEISNISEALEVDKQSLIYDTNVYMCGGEAEPEEITVHDVEEYVYNNPALMAKVLELYTDFQNDNTDCYHDAALEMWRSFVEWYNYESRECGQDPLYWEG